jgi:putative tryptophan/tyrosine transport system substrate-binding protein
MAIHAANTIGRQGRASGLKCARLDAGPQPGVAILRRRDFITLVGGAAAWPVAARAQQLRRIGVLVPNYSQTDREGQARIAAFLDTFQRLGWADGRNVRIEYRWDAGDSERAKASAAELVRSAPEVIVASAPTALAEIHGLTNTIPIVFIQVSDPVGGGFVAGLARPGGNITGFQNFEPAIGGKWLGVLREAVPSLTLLWQIYLRCFCVLIHIRQFGHC